MQENYISPNYFATTGMRLAEGRPFEERDGENAPKVAIINRAMSRALFSESESSRPALRIRHGLTPKSSASSRTRGSTAYGSRPTPMAFYPMAQGCGDPRSLDVRAVGDPRSIAAAVRAGPCSK